MGDRHLDGQNMSKRILAPFFHTKWLVGCCFALMVVAPASAAPPGGAASWQKTWYDEFNGTTIDSTKWGYGSLPWGGNHHNDEYSSYITSEDSYLDGGSLILRCRSGSFGGYPWSEGMLFSNGKLDYTYGYVEVRARFPKGKGIWPAFWLNGTFQWPPEFDIAEYFGSDDRMHMGLAYGTCCPATWNSSNFYGEGVDSWHIWGLEWGPGYALWYKDGVVKKSIYASYVPAENMYVILNSGMRWDYDGTTPAPNYTEMDYFRKYDPPSAVINDTTTGTGMNQFNYAGSWSSGSQGGAFFNDNSWSSAAGAYVELQFSGTRVDFYGAKASNHGIGAMSIDGGPETLVDYYASSRADMALLYSASGLTNGTHTLKVRVTGTRNAGSSGNSITVDRANVWNVTRCLKGTLIGTDGTYGGGNTKEKAVDGNIDSYFDGPVDAADESWLGYDFGVEKWITRVLYCPRTGYSDRMVGGLFQGANTTNFNDAVNLFTVTTAPEEGTMTEQFVSTPDTFRYVRYLGPTNSYGNVAEVEFYGGNAAGSTVADWDFEDGVNGQAFTPSGQSNGSGGSVDAANDILMRGYDDYYGPSWTSAVAPNGGSLAMSNADNHQDGYVTEGVLHNWSPTVWTIECMAYLEELAGFKTFIGRDGSSQGVSESDFYLQKSDSNKLRINVASVGGQRWILDGNYPVQSNTWYAVAARSDGSSLSLWLDDGTGYQQIGSTNISAQSVADNALPGSSFNWTFGRGWYNGGYVDHIDGRMDNIRFSNVALAPEEMIPLNPAPAPSAPTGLAAVSGDEQVTLFWNVVSNAMSYSVKRSTTNGGPYGAIASTTETSHLDATAVNGTTYYYVVSATGSGGESTNSIQAVATPTSSAPVDVLAFLFDGTLTLWWPPDHTGWKLQSQTNPLAAGLGTNWHDVLDSQATNRMLFPVDLDDDSVFYRLAHP